MNVVVCNGSYNYDTKKNYVRVVMCDEDNYFWVVNNAGKVSFPGYMISDNEDFLDKAVSCSYRFFNGYRMMNYYGSFEFYNTSIERDSNGKRIYKNNLSVHNCFIMRVHSEALLPIIKDGKMFIRKTYDELVNCVSKSSDSKYKQEMLTILKMLPTELLEKGSVQKRLIRR